MTNNESLTTPRTKGRSIIRSGDRSKVLYDSDSDKSERSSNIIRSGDGRKILYEKKE